MITILGPQNSPEFTAAKQLENLIVSAWPSVLTNNNHDIKIVASAKCYGESPRDVDLLVFAHLAKQFSTRTNNNPPRQVVVRSFCLAIEIKDHPPEKIRFIGNSVEVSYNNNWKTASEQSFKQSISVFKYLDKQGVRPPFVINLIWLRGVLERDLPAVKHNLIGADANWETILRRISDNCTPQRNIDGGFEITALFPGMQASDLARATLLFTREMTPSSLDRKKMEEISRKVLKGQQYGEKFGEQLLIYRGRGGTGKTVRLLKLAQDLYEDRDKRVLILTYNKALVSDIRRLTTLMKIPDDVAEHSIGIQTVHSFLHSILTGLGIITVAQQDFLEHYGAYKREALELLRGAIEPRDIEQLIKRNNAAFSWDYIFIDEAQDFPSDERDILFAIYGFKNFVIADGVDQLVRTHKHIDWRENVPHRDTQIVRLDKSLRLKAGLSTFTNAFAKAIELDDWSVEPNFEIPGGRVLILEGSYHKNRVVHDEIFAKNQEQLNRPVDMLFCVPPVLAQTESGQEGDEPLSIVAHKFKEWGFDVWDGIAEIVRESYPTRLEQLRIVQYDSCRGLEGWTVVNLAFDELFDYKVRTFKSTDEEAAKDFFDRGEAARRHALRWLMIPLTRAIDTLVIQVSSGDTFVKDNLRIAARECNSIVEWKVVE